MRSCRQVQQSWACSRLGAGSQGAAARGQESCRAAPVQTALSYLPTAPRLLRSAACGGSGSLLSTGQACCSASHPFSKYQHEKFKYYPSLGLFSKNKTKNITSLDSHFPHAKGGHNRKHSLTDSRVTEPSNRHEAENSVSQHFLCLLNKA